MNTIIHANQLTKVFSQEGVGHTVLNGIDLGIEKGSFTVVMGASGAGKSTLLYMLSGMDRPTSGTIQFGGTDITKLTESNLARFRRTHCGFVFQQIHLLDNMSAMDNILTAGYLATKDRRAIVERANALLDRFRVPTGVRGKFPAQVSGGEAQRVGVARALINAPHVLFADEPTGALDQASGMAVLNALTEAHEGGQTIVLVTHDLKSARRGDRLLYMRDGTFTGELRLGAYSGEDDIARGEKLRVFLADMGW